MPRCVLHDVLVYVCVCDELQVVSAPHPSHSIPNITDPIMNKASVHIKDINVCIKNYTIGTADMRTRVLSYHICIAAHTSHQCSFYSFLLPIPPLTLFLFFYSFFVRVKWNTISFICKLWILMQGKKRTSNSEC